jgi:NADPH-dependent glutamate synthase beta subunit-like oxidoreductase
MTELPNGGNRIEDSGEDGNATPGHSASRNYESMLNDHEHWENLVACRVACPIGTDACGYVNAIERGDYAEAYRIARASNPFVSICANVCGAPCEDACRRGSIDKPVEIRALKRFVTVKHGVEAGEFQTEPVTPSHDEKVAIIGAGVAGLTAAHDLTQSGYQVTVFEASALPGGLLRHGVPIYRLDRRVIELEIESILNLGVELKTNARLGEDFTLDDLRGQGYKAILLAIGLERGRTVPIPGHDQEGITDAISFLRDFNAGRPPLVGNRVIVIGGGNVALDVARSVKRLGQPEVLLVCLEGRKEMPALAEEVREALEEDVQFFNGWGPDFISRQESGLLLETKRCLSVSDADGRFNPTFDASDRADFTADTIIFSVGQASDTSFLGQDSSVRIDDGLIQVDWKTGQTSLEDVFAAGDISTGPRMFVDAIAAGQRAARGIQSYFGRSEASPKTSVRWRPSSFRMNQALGTPRKAPPFTEGEIRITSLEPYEDIYTETEAKRQASRCLHCNVNTLFNTSMCIACGDCVRICPERLIRIVPGTMSWHENAVGIIPPLEDEVEDQANAEEQLMLKDESTCTRCGLCVDACPTRAVALSEFRMV